ncbi:hypothetical protein FGRMN_2411 [Fusarium graminum]|nr:hypothetical protein FGRMN_2411 [Fusarium graminum]
MVTTRASSRGASVGPESESSVFEFTSIPATPSRRKRTIKTSSASTGSAKKRRISVDMSQTWYHAPSSPILFWLAISLPLVAWDIGYVFGRPHTMPDGYLHWPIYVPYALYGKVDYIYGQKALDSNNGFTAAQTALNVVETAMYLVYLWMICTRADKAAAKRTVKGRDGALAVMIGYSAAVMTLSKTVLYWANEYYSGFSNIAHNTPLDIFTLWVLPNGFWIVLPAYMIYKFGKEILDGLALASGPSMKKSIGKKSIE